MPFVNIRLVRDVIADDPEAKKAKLASKMVDAVNEVTGIAKDDVWVVFEEVDARDWYVGERNVATRRRSS